MLSKLTAILAGIFSLSLILMGAGYAESTVTDDAPPLLQSPMKLSGQVSLLQAGTGSASSNKDSKGSIYMPCKQKRGKSGYKHIELGTPGGRNWELVVNQDGITPLTAATLRVKHN